MKQVELHPASVWDCEECGRENFCRMVKPELTEEDLQELREDHGLHVCDTGLFLMAPDKVKCAYCFFEFETTEDRDQ